MINFGVKRPAVGGMSVELRDLCRCFSVKVELTLISKFAFRKTVVFGASLASSLENTLLALKAPLSGV
jgi:phenylalanine-4-hydroxylase